MPVIIKKTDVDGVFTVHRREDEKPFAQLTAPRAMGGNKWGIKYRGQNPDDPFADPTFNVCPSTLEEARHEFEQILKVCSDYQLRLE